MKYSGVAKEDLTSHIQSFKKHHPNCEEKVVSGANIRELIREVDPQGVEARCKTALKRREYSVPCLLFLWHVDGNRKFIQYKIGIHVGRLLKSNTVIQRSRKPEPCIIYAN